MIERTRRLTRGLLVASLLASLGGAGLSGWWFASATMDLVLLQLVFYGCWACLLGSWGGGLLGAAMEEDACGTMDMGVLSSMGAIGGTLAAGLVGTGLTGLAFSVPWWWIWLGSVGLTGLTLVRTPWEVARAPGYDHRGHRVGATGERLPDQPLRMRDRVAILLVLCVVIQLGLTLAMARMMGSDLGHPVMMAPMMYGMLGTMLGGLLGGWLAGLMDEHTGRPEHDNPVMVSAMALMAGMMGGMPSGMVGGMLAVMGERAIALCVSGGLTIVFLGWLVTFRGRYVIRRREGA